VAKLFRHDGDGAPVRAKGVVHELVAETAKAFARTVYEQMAKDNDWYKLWPDEEYFVRRRWQSFVQPAREHLAELLHPDKHYMTTEQQREQIHEAILLNAAVNPAENDVDQIIRATSLPFEPFH
jgi:hypothetical protein